jgi:hypothetical protein
MTVGLFGLPGIPETPMAEPIGLGILDTRLRGYDSEERANIVAQNPPKSTLAPMVNRVLTSPYLWWFDPLPVGPPDPRQLLKVLAFQTWQ